jgi:hypothetical protein
MLAGAQIIARFAELVSSDDCRCLCSAIFYAGVTVAGDAKSEIEWTIAANTEAQVGSHDDVARRRCHLDFDRSTIEGQHQGRGAGCALARGDVEATGGTYADSAAAIQSYICCMILCGDGGVSYKDGTTIVNGKFACHGSVLHSYVADRPLRLTDSAEYREQKNKLALHLHHATSSRNSG